MKTVIAGIDEVGRGCLAGPVIAACVVFKSTCPEGIADSKALSDTARRILSESITQEAWVSIGEASIEEITNLNILHATMLAMKRAHQRLPEEARHTSILVDGNRIPSGLAVQAKAIIKGDSKIPEIAAASIVAKVYRDDLMLKLHEEHPQYAWDRNKGYGSPAHLQALSASGVTAYHRPTFAPVKKCLEKPSDHLPA